MLNEMIFRLLAVLHCRKGVSSLEYAILAVAIIGAVSAAMTTLGSDIKALFNSLENAITAATT